MNVLLPGRPRRYRPARARRSWRRWLGIALGVVIILAGAGFGIQQLVHYWSDKNATCMNQGATIITHEGASGECVGITDGSYQFDPADSALVHVENLIKAEDQWVRNKGVAYVSIAYLMPISAGAGGVEPIQTAAEELQGAYAVQHYANHTSNVLSNVPLIQLLIASSGNQADAYPTAVQDIQNDVSSRHLVAVAGIGVSLDTTIAEVKDLAGADIPVFGSSITSDDFDNIVNMVRVSPSNQQEVNAALAFIKPRVTTAFLIKDTNPIDSYDTTIVKEFSKYFQDTTHHFVAAESFDTAGDTGSKSPVAQRVANRIGQMTSDICLSKPGVVLYAGRGRDLATLLTDLAGRPCLTQPVTILTGDDVTDMPITSGVKQGLASGVTLYYVGEASPAEWNKVSSPVLKQDKAGYIAFSGQFAQLFPGVSDNDSNAMMGWDSTLTAIHAIRLAGSDPTPGDVDGEFSALQGSRVVPGASGPINLPANYANGQGSNPVGKPVPILTLQPNGIIYFVQLELPPS